MLRHFKHENVIGLRDLVPPPEDEPFNDIYIVLDFMETDLHKIIYSKNELTDEHIQVGTRDKRRQGKQSGPRCANRYRTTG